jgi:hypothetical protein
MSTEFQKIKEIASASLMPDFFAVRIDEEGLYDKLQELIRKLKFPQPMPQLDRIKQVAAASADCNTFIENVKTNNLWTSLREFLSKLRF